MGSDIYLSAGGAIVTADGIPLVDLEGVGPGPGGDGVEEVAVTTSDPGAGYDLWYDPDATSSATGGSEVAVGPTDPGSSYDLWYDPDAIGTPPSGGGGSPSGAAGGALGGTYPNPTLSVATQAELDAKATTVALNALASVYQPIDADLSAIAALATTGYGRSVLTAADATAAKTLLSITDGADGPQGDPGEPGGALLSAFWTFATATTAPPSSGQARSDAGMTQLWLAELDTDGMNRAMGLATAEAGDTIIVRAANGTAMNLLITGTPTDSGTYWSFPVSVTSGTLTKGARTQVGILSPTPHGIPAGGTTGQYLAKTSATDYDATWQTGSGGGGAPTGAAGGSLGGTYPNPTLSVATQAELDAKATAANLTAEAALARNGNNITSGTVADARIASTIARDSEVTAAVAAEAALRAPIRRLLVADTTTAFAPVVATHENTMVTLSNALGITVTLPSNATSAFAIGAEVDFLWLGVGQPTFVAGSGATVNATPGLKLRSQYAACTAKKISTNGWVLLGDLSSSA